MLISLLEPCRHTTLSTTLILSVYAHADMRGESGDTDGKYDPLQNVFSADQIRLGPMFGFRFRYHRR